MTSTERRARRDAALLEAWCAWCVMGMRVTVQRANGEHLKTTLTRLPFRVNGRGAYVQVDGLPGNVALHRVSRGWGKE
jgi:inhibitor of KinA sporulation pathway (predicted exonuclease)